MRDLFLVLIFSGLIVLTFRRPFVGVLGWLWVALMNPHRETYGFALEVPFNLIIALVTLTALTFSGERQFRKTPKLIALLVAFSISMTISTYFGLTPEYSITYLSQYLKTLLLCLVIGMVAQHPVRLHALVWIIAISIGYFSIKGGLFTIATGGVSRVYGPEDSMIYDNNHLALAAVLALPMFYYLQKHSRNKFVKTALKITLVLSVIAVVGSFSRGGLIALIAMGLSLLVTVRNRILVGAVTITILLSVLALVPQQWSDRMETIQAADEDKSFQQRLDSWAVDLNIALDRPIIGGGLRAYHDNDIYFRYNRNPDSPNTFGRAAHSIYFEVLADQGFTGLLLFLLIALFGWRCSGQVIVITKDNPDLLWATDLAAMIRIALIGFMVGGAALSMAHYDLFYVYVGMSAALLETVRRLTAAPQETI